MKDFPHHLKKLQRKVLQGSRYTEIETKRLSLAENGEEILKKGLKGFAETDVREELLFAIADSKRKGTRDYVRHMSQRERAH